MFFLLFHLLLHLRCFLSFSIFLASFLRLFSLPFLVDPLDLDLLLPTFFSRFLLSFFHLFFLLLSFATFFLFYLFILFLWFRFFSFFYLSFFFWLSTSLLFVCARSWQFFFLILFAASAFPYIQISSVTYVALSHYSPLLACSMLSFSNLISCRIRHALSTQINQKYAISIFSKIRK